MKVYILVRYFCTIAFCINVVSVEAKEVTLQHKGITLNADLEFAADKKIDDGLIFISHGALAHRDMEMLVYLRKLLKESGYNTLAINLSLGLNNRHGMYDCKVTHRHLNNDAIHEIDIWIDWLEKQGANEITILGHSRGGAQTAFYAAERDNRLVKAVILLAPAVRENTDAAGYQQRYKKPLAPLLENAQKLIKAGKGGEVLDHANLMTCRDTPVTADSFVSYYGQDPRLDTPYLMSKIKKPTLVVVAGDDKIVIDLDKRVAQLVDGKRVQMKIIDGSDHLFRDLNTDDAVDAIDTFLQELRD